MHKTVVFALAASSLVIAAPAVAQANAASPAAMRIAKVLLDVAHDADPAATATFDLMKIGRRNALLAINKGRSKDFDVLFEAEWQAWRASVENEIAARQAARFDTNMNAGDLQTAAAFLESPAGRHFLAAMRSSAPAGTPLVNGYQTFEERLKARLLAAGMKYE